MLALANHDAEATYQLYPYVRLHDEIVGEQHAAPPDRDPLWLPNPPLTLSHAGAMADDRILADIGLRLRNETPLSHEPATPLPEP